MRQYGYLLRFITPRILWIFASITANCTAHRAGMDRRYINIYLLFILILLFVPNNFLIFPRQSIMKKA